MNSHANFLPMNEGLTSLFSNEVEIGEISIIELQDRFHKPVAALYLEKLDPTDFIISTTNNDEKYYCYLKFGVGIFFTYYRKIHK